MLLTIFLRTLFFYAFVLVVIRIMGKREVGQLSPFDLVVSIMIAESAVMAIEDPRVPVMAGVVAILTLMGAEVVLSYASLKSLPVRLLVTGRPSVVVKNGQVVEKELARIRYNMHDLLSQLREKGVTSPEQVEFAVVEATGRLSVIPKAEYRPLQPRDMNLSPNRSELPGAVVVDGTIDARTLKERRWTVDRLMQELSVRGYGDPADILYASLDSEGELYIQPRQQKEGPPGDGRS